MSPRALARLFATLLVLALCVLGSSGCQMMTPAQAQEWGTRTYAGTTVAAAYRATLTAVRSQGYDIAATDASNGQIKTAPKVMVVVVSGSQYSAAAASNSLAWDFDITSGAAGITIHATPRGYSAGQTVPPDHMSAGYMKKAFATLFDEIERDLGVVPAQPGASAAPAAASAGTADAGTKSKTH